MTESKFSKTTSREQLIFGFLSPIRFKEIRFLISVIGVLGTIGGFAGVVFTLNLQGKQQRIQISTTIANTAAQGIDKITSPHIHYTLKQMHRQDFPMKGIAVPGTLFLMAEFEGVQWSDVIMDDVEFTCSNQSYDRIREFKEGDPKNPFCARLKGADFIGASLSEAIWNWADLRGTDFTASYLKEAQIFYSIASEAKFLGNIYLRGVTIKNSNLANAKFSTKARFECTLFNKDCVSLQRSDFSSAVMNNVDFRGAEIEQVDFTNAKLEKAKFDCELEREGKRPCTTLKEVCFQSKDGERANLEKAEFEGVSLTNVNFTDANLKRTTFKDTTISITDFTGANLTRARFENIKIANVDFTGANLTNTDFKNVEFYDVVLSEEQEAAADFNDESSRAGLHKARRTSLSPRDADETPCSPEWTRDIKDWQDRFALNG